MPCGMAPTPQAGLRLLSSPHVSISPGPVAICSCSAHRVVVGAPQEVKSANQTGGLYQCDYSTAACEPIQLQGEPLPRLAGPAGRVPALAGHPLRSLCSGGGSVVGAPGVSSSLCVVGRLHPRALLSHDPVPPWPASLCPLSSFSRALSSPDCDLDRVCPQCPRRR